jgi:hypothetical protein
MENYERVEKLEEAQELINKAVNLIHEAFEGKNERSRLDSYICGHLRGWANGGNRYDTTAIPRLIEQLENEEKEAVCHNCGCYISNETVECNEEEICDNCLEQ